MGDFIDDPFDDEENPAVKLASLAVLGLGLASLFLGFEWFWVVFVVGFAVIVPAVKVVTDELGIGATARKRERRTADADDPGSDATATADDPDSAQDALDTLRERYARGDLTEAEFERKVETLLGTETPESARRHVERGAGDRETSDRVRETEMAEFETDERAR